MVVIVSREPELASRFAVALRSQLLAHRNLRPKGTRGWRVVDAQSVEAGVWPVRVLPPRFSTLPVIEVDLASPEEFQRRDDVERSAASVKYLSRYDGFVILLDEATASGSADWARALVAQLQADAAADLGSRIDASVAIVDPLGAAEKASRRSKDELKELSSVLISRFTAARVFEVPLGASTSPDGDAAARAAAGEVLHWVLTAIDPRALDPGLSGALARTPSPALGWYALVMWLFVVLAPSTPMWLAHGLCRGGRAATCSQRTQAVAVELGEAGIPLVGIAVVAALALFSLTSLLHVLGRIEVPASGGQASIREGRFRRAVGSALAAAWIVALLPRTLLVGSVQLVFRDGMDVNTAVLEAALAAEDFRGASVLGALVVSLCALTVAAVASRRRSIRLFAARRETQGRLLQRRR